MQLRFTTGHTSDTYVKGQVWREARLEHCPRHPGGGCDFRRHGTYGRKRPEGARVPRWYCRTAHQTFSLLADCLAARLPGTLTELEQVVVAVEQAPSLEAAADRLRPEIDLPGAIRWVRRRLQRVYHALTALRGLFPEYFGAVPATVEAFAAVLGTGAVLLSLRELAVDFLSHLPTPLGFHHRAGGGGDVTLAMQQPMGPDPPAGAR